MSQSKKSPLRNLSSLQSLIKRTEKDSTLRNKLVNNPKETIEKKLNISLPVDHEIHIHQNTKQSTHLVIPPSSSFATEEHKAALSGGTSLEFLKRTMHDPAPAKKLFKETRYPPKYQFSSPENVVKKIQSCILEGLNFVEKNLAKDGSWYCIRYNIADASIPRHYERPPFVSAYCGLALQDCPFPQTKKISELTRRYILETMEHPGVWRYYRHLPPDLDCTTTCALFIRDHPWVQFGGMIPKIIANRDSDGLFLTWFLTVDEPDVASKFRIEADPVVNANVTSFLGEIPETKQPIEWLHGLLQSGDIEKTSKWYPDAVTICYSISRAIKLRAPNLDHLSKPLVETILGSRDTNGSFENVLQTAQAITGLSQINQLDQLNVRDCTEFLVQSQGEDGGWPELLAFGDKKLRWGSIGQIGHGSQSMTTAFCIEALIQLANSFAKQ